MSRRLIHAFALCGALDHSTYQAVTSMNDLMMTGKDIRCEVVSTRGLKPAQDSNQTGKDGSWRVSPLWGQHAIGADLASEFVLEKQRDGAASRVPMGIIDQLSDREPAAPIRDDATRFELLPSEAASSSRYGNRKLHGDHVADLVSSPKFGASPAVSWAALINLAPQDDGDFDLKKWNSKFTPALQAIEKSSAQIIIASIAYQESSAQAAVDSLVRTGRTFVQAAGNSYPLSSQSADHRQTGHIVVGSIAPNGLPSALSQEPVRILAPADIAQLSDSENRFGGTSGAAPLVAGSLANALALRESLSNDDLERLLVATALPAFPSDGSGRNGTVNAYRLAVVASCLGENHEQVCLDQSKKASELRKTADRLLRSPTCISQRDGLKSLRASFLLQPTAETASHLAGLYTKLGFRGDAEWYKTMAAALGDIRTQRRRFQDLLNEPSLGTNRYFGGTIAGDKARGYTAFSLASRLSPEHEFSKMALEKIKRDLANVKGSSKKARAAQDRIIHQALILGPRALPLIEPLIVDSADLSDERSAANIIALLTGSESGTHAWITETNSFFKGTKFEKYLPSSAK